MTAEEKRQLGEDMIWAGKMSEFHQQRRNWAMYEWWNAQYQEMMRRYHGR